MAWAHIEEAMFLFFSNRIGCFGSLLLSLAVTVLLLLVYAELRGGLDW